MVPRLLFVLAAVASEVRAFAPPPQRRAVLQRRPAPCRMAAAPAHLAGAYGTALVAETGNANDPFLLGLASVSIVLFVLVVGGVIFLTAKEQLGKKALEEDEVRERRLPTLAELDADAPMAPTDPGNPNRRAKRENAKMKMPKMGDGDRF